VSKQHFNSTRWLMLAATAATLLLAVALATGWQVGVSGEWVWRNNTLRTVLWPALVVGILLVVMTGVAGKPGRWTRLQPASRAIMLALFVLLVLALQWTLLTAVASPSLSWVAPGWIIASPNATTYFSASFEVRDARRWLASYPELMSSLPYHARTHPPGFMLFFLLVRRFTAAAIPRPPALLAAIAEGYNQTFGTLFSPADAAAAIIGAAAVALLGALSLLPLYALGRTLVGAKEAILGVALMSGMPGLLLLAASPDQIILLLAVLVLWLCYSAWRRNSPLHAFLAGVAAGVGLFFSLGFAVVGIWLLLWALLGLLGSGDRRMAARRALGAGVIALAGFALFHLVLYLACGYRPIAVAQQAFLAHRDITTSAFPRTYWKWLLMNPLEIAIFAGLPLVLTALWSARSLHAHPTFFRLRPFLIAWLLTLALLDLSGTVRGEVGRIWLFLLWPAPLAAAAWLALSRQRRWILVMLVLLQLAQALVMRTHITIYSIL